LTQSTPAWHATCVIPELKKNKKATYSFFKLKKKLKGREKGIGVN